MKKLLTGRWLIAHLVVLATIIVLINLGLWQLRRLEERRAYNQRVSTGLAQPPLTLTGVDVDPDALDYRRVTVTGTFDNAGAILLRNQSYNGWPGHHLLVPLRINGSDKAVLIDRGWLPLDLTEPDKRTAYDVTGEVNIEGVAQRGQTRPNRFAPADPTLAPNQTRLDAWFRVDINRIAEQLPYPLLPIYVQQLPDPQASPDILPRPEGPPPLTEGSHLGYAFQWFSFAVILVITYAFFLRQELKPSRIEDRG